MADAAVEIIPPSDRLRSRVGARFGGVDPAVLARAEAALLAMSDRFPGWIEEEVARLEAARDELRRGEPGALQHLQSRAHDLKGLGGTYGFPLVTRACASLSRLLDDGSPTPAAMALAGAHVAAVRMLVREGVRDAADAAGAAVCEDLEAQVAARRPPKTSSALGR